AVGPSGMVFTGPIDLAGAARIVTVSGSNGNLIFSGPVSGTAGSALIKEGAGTLTFFGSASYSGPTAVSAGTLVFASTQLLSGALYVTNGARTIVTAGGSSVLVTPAVSVDLPSG